MALENSPGSPHDVSIPSATMASPVTSDEKQWAAWRARGVEHDAAVRRKMMIGAPILAVLGAVLYGLFAR